MSLATEKVKNRTTRTQLVRITVCRHISDLLVELDPGGKPNLYTATLPFTFAFAGVELNATGANFTEVADEPNADLEYRVNEAARTIEICSVAIPNSTTNNFALLYYLFFANGETEILPEDPLDTGTTTREWEPRLIGDLSSKQSFGNVLYGKITFANSAVRLSSEHGFLHQHFSSKASIANRPIEAWQFLGATVPANGLRLFRGRCGNPAFDRSTVTIGVFDEMLALEELATMGDPEASLYAAATTFPRDIGKPCPLILAPTSFHETKRTSTVSTTPQIYPTFLTDAVPATVDAYDPVLGGTTNRAWRLCRLLATLPNQTFGSPTLTATSGAGQRFIKFASHANLAVGQTFSWTQAATRYYATIVHVGAFNYGGDDYDIAIDDSVNPFTVGSATVHANPAIGLIIRGMSGYEDGLFPYYHRDYTIGNTALGTGLSYRLDLTFANNFESNFSPAAPSIDPNQHSLSFMILQTTSLLHGTVVQKLLEKAGLTVDAASITAANAALAESTYFQIPYRSEQSYASYARYLEPILAGALAYLRVGTDNEVEYKLLAAPAAGIELDDTNCKLDGIDLAYEDAASTLRFENDHLAAGATAPGIARVSTHATFVKQLYGSVKEAPVDHALGPTNAIGRSDEAAGLRSRRLAVYALVVATLAIEAILGDDVTVTADWILGAAGTKNLKIIDLEKGRRGITIKAADLEGLA